MANDWLVSIIGGTISTIVGGVILAMLVEKIGNKKKPLVHEISKSDNAPSNTVSFLKTALNWVFWIWFGLCMLLFLAFSIVMTQTFITNLLSTPSALALGFVSWVFMMGVIFVGVLFLLVPAILIKIFVGSYIDSFL